MAATPEAKIKKMVRDVLKEFTAETAVPRKANKPHGFTPDFTPDVYAVAVSDLYQYWPVPSGFGASSLDCIVSYRGLFIAIETKAPGKNPTPRQELTIAEIKGGGGLTFVIDGPEGCAALRSALELIRFSHDANDH